MTVDSYLGVLEIARHSDWAAFIPVTGMLDEIDSKDLHIYPITRSSLSFRWHLLHQVGKPLTNAARIFVDTIVNDLDVKRQRWQMLVSK